MREPDSYTVPNNEKGLSKMKQFLAKLVLFVAAALAASAPAYPDVQTELNTFKELQQSKWETQKELQQKDVEILRQQVAAVDKRVDDQLNQTSQAIDRYGVAATWSGIVITVLLVLGGFLGYRNAKAEAKEAAALQAESSAKHWFEAQTVRLQERIHQLEQQANSAKQKIAGVVRDVEDVGSTSKESIDKALKEAQEALERQQGGPDGVLHQGNRVLALQDELLRKTAEDSYSFSDWNTRAHAAYEANKLEDAAYFWQRASTVPNAGAVNVAGVSVNRGWAFAQMQHTDAALQTFENVVEVYGETADHAVLVHVARAMLSKGSALGIASKYGEAISAYEQLIRRFDSFADPTFREYISQAYNGRAFAKLLRAKATGPETENGKDDLRDALVDLDLASERMTQLNGAILGNRAYVQFLLGNVAQAEANFAAALRAPKFGGEQLYKATLEDLQMHTVASDGAARQLLDQAWLTYKQEQEQRPGTAS